MIRRKTLIAYPHPDYCGKDYWYTLNLKHGGTVANDMSKLGYIGGTVSKFDFFDSRMLSWRKYIDSLCEQLGYLGSKNLYGMDEGSNTLKKIECELDIYNVILTGSESREFTIYLEAKKTINHDDGEEIEGSVVYIDEELEESNEEVGEKRVCGLWLVEKGQNQPMGSSDSEDEDYICVDDSGDEVLDRVMFKENIDADVEWLGSKKQNDGDSSKSSESGNESCDMNESDFDSVASEEFEEHGCSNSVRSESSTAYSIANEIHAPQPRQIGVQIRAPPPMSFHPQHFVGSHKDKESMQVFTQGGTKFATLSSLRVGRMKGKEANK